MRTIVPSFSVGLLFLAWFPSLHAHDLILQDLKVIKVSPCDRQMRLTVRHDAVGHEHLAGKTGTGPYRIEIYSRDRKKIIYELPVKDHNPGETLFFVVPSGKLVCDSRIRISVDADNAVAETNEKNNIGRQTLSRPKSSGLIENCPIEPDRCP